MALGGPTYPTEALASAAPADIGSSAACDTYRHDDCVGETPPRQIALGMNYGRWSPRWTCDCPCHSTVEKSP